VLAKYVASLEINIARLGIYIARHEIYIARLAIYFSGTPENFTMPLDKSRKPKEVLSSAPAHL
jgi:hypothetical protein